MNDSRDVLSNILHGIQIQGLDVAEVAFFKPWSIDGQRDSACFYCMLQGRGRFAIEGVETSGTLDPGDLLVILQERGHILRQEPDGQAILSNRLISGRFHFDRRFVGALLAMLPPHIHLKGVNGETSPWLAETLGHIVHESAPGQPGRNAILDRVAQIVFIEAVRACMQSPESKNGNLLAGLLDPDIGPVLEAMHDQPAFPWTVASLAERAGMSRSIFAHRFKEVLSITPFQYLLDCRMRKACELLTDDRYGIKKIASLSGYSTEAAFANAFKRWSGKTPGTFRRSAPRGKANGEFTERPRHGSESGAAVLGSSR
jgi:AraC-like DNA-binding protein